jgi:hypothetical protein
MLKETRALVAQAADQGKSAEQMKQDHLLAKYEELGKGFINTEIWIDLLYVEATKKGGAEHLLVAPDKFGPGGMAPPLRGCS